MYKMSDSKSTSNPISPSTGNINFSSESVPLKSCQQKGKMHLCHLSFFTVRWHRDDLKSLLGRMTSIVTTEDREDVFLDIIPKRLSTLECTSLWDEQKDSKRLTQMQNVVPRISQRTRTIHLIIPSMWHHGSGIHTESHWHILLL